MTQYFPYGKKEIEYLSERDQKLGHAIEQIGHIYREVTPDVFSGIVRIFVGQQISSKAQKTIMLRMQEEFKEITPEVLWAASLEDIQKLGTSFRKAEYIKGFTEKVVTGELNLEEIKKLPNDELMAQLTSIRGLGPWSAEMVMLFCLQRKDVLSFGDLAIRRGICKLHNLEELNKKEFKKFQDLYSPYGSVASLYYWEISGGQVKVIK